MRRAGNVARMEGEDRRSASRVLVGEPEEKRTLGRPKRNRMTILREIFRKWDGEEYELD